MVAVVPDREDGFDVEALIEHCRVQVARFAVPRYVRIVDALPKTSSQRVQKFKLRAEGVPPGTYDREAVT